MTTNRLTQGRVTWTTILHPTPQDIANLSGAYPNFHPLNLQDCQTELEIPKLDHHDDYLFLVVHMPCCHDGQRQTYRPAEVDIFISRGTLVTSHRGELDALQELYQRLQSDPRQREDLMGRGASPLLYYLLNNLLNTCAPIVQRLERELRQVEQTLFTGDPQHLLYQTAHLRRDIIVLRHILGPQLEVIQKLTDGTWDFIHEDLDLYWGDLSDHLKQYITFLDAYAEMIDGLSDTIDTLASHRIDAVVRLLTVVTVLTLPVTLLATIFGMNVVMPFAQHPGLFFTLIAVGLGLTVWLVWYLRKRNWL